MATYRDGTNRSEAGAHRGRVARAATRGHSPGQDTFRLFTGDMNHLVVNRRLYRIVPDANGKLRGDLQGDIGFANNVSAIEYNEKLDLLFIATQTEGFYTLRKSKFQMPDFPPPLQEQLSRYLFGPAGAA